MWRCVSVVLLVMAALPAWGNTQLLDAWLRDKAAPKLAEVLGKHPKFKGSRIRFVGVDLGQPTPIDNGLAAEISRVLTHRVLQAGAADVEGPSSRSRCRRVLASEPYLVGIDIQSETRSRHRVNLAIMDVEEGVRAQMLGHANRAAPLPRIRVHHVDMFGAHADGVGVMFLRLGPFD